MRVKAITSFEHGGSRRRNEEFVVSESIGEQLEAKGLVEIVNRDEDPDSAAVEHTSVTITTAGKQSSRRRVQGK